MENISSTEATSFLKRNWEGFKEFLIETSPSMKACSMCLIREDSIPFWSSSDVEEFIASDPNYGPTLKTTREAKQYCAYGSVIGGLSSAALSWKYSRSLHGAAVSFGVGACFGWVFGHEIGNHAKQVYRVDTKAAQFRFLEWWENKCQGRA